MMTATYDVCMYVWVEGVVALILNIKGQLLWRHNNCMVHETKPCAYLVYDKESSYACYLNRMLL